MMLNDVVTSVASHTKQYSVGVPEPSHVTNDVTPEES
jgi:hypothetical protein